MYQEYEHQQQQQQEQLDLELDMESEYNKFHDTENIGKRISQEYFEFCNNQSNILTEVQSFHYHSEDHLTLIIEVNDNDNVNDNENNHNGIRQQYDEQDNSTKVTYDADAGDNLITIEDVNELNEAFYRDNDFVRYLWADIQK